SSVKTWLFRILTNTAHTRAARERRSVPFSSLAQVELESGEAAVDPDRFIPQGERWASYWASAPKRFDDQPEARLFSSETLGVARVAIEALPVASSDGTSRAPGPPLSASVIRKPSDRAFTVP